MFIRISVSMIICVWLTLRKMKPRGNGIVVQPSALRMVAKILLCVSSVQAGGTEQRGKASLRQHLNTDLYYNQ